MDQKQKAEAAHAFFVFFTDRQSERLDKAKAARKEIEEVLESGGTPTGPRVTWIRQTAEAFFDLLALGAERFEQAMPDDVITINDVADVIATIQSTFDSQHKEDGEEPNEDDTIRFV